MVADLHQLLANAGIAPPYVLVGHSFGGLNVRLYASEHPEETVGMVLVDATPAEWLDRMKADAPAGVASSWRSGSLAAEGGWDIDASLTEVQTASLPAMPVILLEHTPGQGDNLPGGWPEAEKAWGELQAALAQRIPNSTVRIAEHSGHFIATAQPELVTQAIQQVLAAVSGR